MPDTTGTERRRDDGTGSAESRVSHDNQVFEDRSNLDLGRPAAADAIPKPADPHRTGDDAHAADEDVDETAAGGLGEAVDARTVR